MTSHAAFPELTGTKSILLDPAHFREVILATLALGAKESTELGHDVIYTAYILKTIDFFKVRPWRSLLESVTRLILSVQSSGPGWITVNGQRLLKKLEEPAPETDQNYWTIFADFDRPLPMEVDDMQLGHLLTHGHAIQMLESMVTSNLKADMELSFRKRLFALRAANAEQEDHSALTGRKLDPRTREYWLVTENLGMMHGHAIKYAYSFLDLRRNVVSASDLKCFGRILWPS